MIALILTLAILGLIVYMIESFIPMPAPFRMVIRILVVIFVVLYLVRLFGLDIPIPAR